MGTDSAILLLLAEQRSRVAELEQAVAEKDRIIAQQADALSRASAGDAPERHP